MPRKAKAKAPTVYQFIDEAGDLTLFDRKGRIMVGEEGVSTCFLMGVADLADPVGTGAKLEALRAELLGDPFLASVPSMQPDRNKTAIAFHAKDDCPEVRREVFKLLLATDVKVMVAVRRKSVLASEAAHAFKVFGTKISENDIYDDLLKRLLRDRLHLGEMNELVVAKRGTKNRTAAIATAVDRARLNFARKWGSRDFPPTRISSSEPSRSSGLQVIDYFLWALQRMFERREDRYFAPLASKYRLIMDIDDKRRHAYGEWYSEGNPITLERLVLEAG
jgi:hypothetical protein